MTIRKRGRNSYEVQVELPRDPLTGQRRRRFFNVKGNKKDAERAEREERYKVEHGHDIDRSRLTVGEWLTIWLDETAAHRVRPTTLRRYRSIAVRLSGIIGDVRLQQLRPAHLATAYTRLRSEGMSSQSITHYHRLAFSSLRTAVLLQLLAANVAEAAAPPAPLKREITALTPAQTTAFIAGLSDPDLKRIVEVAAGTGARIGELLALRWADVDLASGRMQITRSQVYTPREGISYSQPKTAAGIRSLSLPAIATEALRSQRKAQLETRMRHADLWDEPGDLVFSDSIGGPLKPYSVSKRFTAAARAAGHTTLTFHGLRHGHASLLLRSGVSDKVAAARLGHASAAVTRAVYQHVDQPMVDSVSETIDRALNGTKAAAAE